MSLMTVPVVTLPGQNHKNKHLEADSVSLRCISRLSFPFQLVAKCILFSKIHEQTLLGRVFHT